ncbi:unnamed protein product [Trichobilharzia regenti]|nr:unnamed protein product [Trichobilharzia regenti]
MTQRPKNAVKRAYYAAEVRCLFTTTPNLRLKNEDKLPKFATSTIQSPCYQNASSVPSSYSTTSSSSSNISPHIIHNNSNNNSPALDQWSATLLAAQALVRTKKVFIGGVSTGTTADELKSFFSEFGKLGLQGCRLSTLIYRKFDLLGGALSCVA